ncbi:MAG: NTP transferase domain-containing protein [Methanophagales archaeon]|nr:NTP transferase domain-containing protein [Methanophagales archaeon]MCW3141704.1 NTP transferase domain-containing protein [Methanophagales archaeon]
MIAIILAGGKSSRLGEVIEKALIKISGQRLIDLVVESVRESKAEDFRVAVTKNTPKTEEFCKLMNYKTIETPGEGYHEDLQYLLPRYHEFVSVACDIPFLRSEHINAIIEAYFSHKPRISITGAVPLDIVPKDITTSYVFEHEGKEFVSCGINVVTSSENSLPFVFNEPLLAININTSDDLSMARKNLNPNVKTAMI